MKKHLFTVIVLFVACSMQANLTLYVSPSGYQGGLTWNTPCSIDSMVSRLNNDINISGEVTIYFSKGHYYNVDIKLWNLSAPITNIHLIGGVTLARRINLNQRNFVANETVFHAKTSSTSSIPIWLESFSYQDSTKISSVDGITITSDNYIMNNEALRLVGGTYVVTHCKIEEYKSTVDLIKLESSIDHNFVINSLIANNVARSVMTVWCNLHMVNTTIADNYLTQLIYSAPFGAKIDNSILWSNYEQTPSAYNMQGTVDVSHSFVETQRTWMVDDNTNQWNVNPLFTYDVIYPYTCSATSTIFAYGDASVFYQYTWALSNHEYQYDVAGNFRFYDYGNYGIYSYADAGAYQHYYQSGGSNYNSVEPVSPQYKPSRMPIEDATNDIHIWTYQNSIFVDGLSSEPSTLTLYTMSGQHVHSATLSMEYQEVQAFVQAGEYLATITASSGELLASKAIYLR